MSPILVVTLVSAAVVAMVLILSLYVISKGYAFKQKVDPLPEEEETDDNEEKNDNGDDEDVNSSSR
jgi:cell division protein FtsL